jgi:hypothetical protein
VDIQLLKALHRSLVKPYMQLGSAGNLEDLEFAEKGSEELELTMLLIFADSKA